MKKRLTVEEAFHAARQRTDPAERTGYLDGACGDDMAMRAKVEELLKADAEAVTLPRLNGHGVKRECR